MTADQHATSTGQPVVDLEAIRRRHPRAFDDRWALIPGSPNSDIHQLTAEVESLKQQLATAQAEREEEHRKRMTLIDLSNLECGRLVKERDHLRAEVEAMRPEVRTFASVMEERLRANDHKGGWRGSLPSYLLRRLREEAVELEEAVSKWSREEVRHEAADVANFALMIADCFGGLASLDAASAGQ